LQAEKKSEMEVPCDDDSDDMSLSSDGKIEEPEEK